MSRRINRQYGLGLVVAGLALACLQGRDSPGGGAPPSPPPVSWYPKWQLYDILSNNVFPGRAWQIRQINRDTKQYYCHVTWTENGQGKSTDEWVDGAWLESAAFWKAG